MTRTTLPRHADAIATQVASYQRYLDHEDKAARLVGLHALYDAIDSCFRQENAPAVYTAAAPGFPERVRLILRRLLP